MTSKQKLQSLVHQLVSYSFVGDKLSQERVKGITKTFARLPLSQSLTYLRTYLRELKKYIEFRSLHVDSSTELSQSQIVAITRTFKKDYLVFEQKVNLDPSLLGGLRIKIGDAIFDYSVKARIAELGKNIAS